LCGKGFFFCGDIGCRCHGANAGIVRGYEDSTFRPDANITHAEAIVMLMNMLKHKPD